VLNSAKAAARSIFFATFDFGVVQQNPPIPAIRKISMHDLIWKTTDI